MTNSKVVDEFTKVVEQIKKNKDSIPNQLNVITEQNLIQKHLSLTSEDWIRIVKSCKQVTYNKDDVIVKAGDTSTRIKQIMKGTCSIKPNNGPTEILKIGAIFGDISLLSGQPSSFTVTANEEVVVNIIEGYYLNMLFASDPVTSSKLFNYLCKVIAEKTILL